MYSKLMRGAAVLVLVLCATAAHAQTTGFVVEATPAGPQVTGSFTHDGVTYTAADIEALADGGSANLSADLPIEVSMAALRLMELRGANQ